ncbi:M28 family metallopeptidase [Sandarakinorhabdus rubra]|uniref:M28 family metallopeptidase n=1 Tax=Sandarakinorhabdus rubra TaxID=2672568 RepID=UPI0013DB262E|nr:M28 family metallopeptidase [Sandarakinorhabdus rubra]
MNKRLLTALAALPLIAAVPVHAQTAGRKAAPDPLAASFRAHVAFLADDTMGGRGIGTPGHEIAANYVAQHFARVGLTPAGDAGRWFQRVSFAESRFASEKETATLDLGSQRLVLENGVSMALSPGNEPGAEEISGEMVFVGYGLQDPSQGIDDFAGLDLRGKYAVVLSGAPDTLNSEVAAHLARNSKPMAAQAAGAIGLITVRTLKEAARLPWEKGVTRARLPRRQLLGPDGKPLGDGTGLKVRAAISDEAAAALFASAPMNFAAVQAAAAKGPVKGFALPGRFTVRRATAVERISSPNVLGLLPGRDPVLKDQIVVISAHLDHVGTKANPKPGEDAIFNGAMDNASGSATLLEAATALAKAPPKRSVLFLATTAEESGLLGADYFSRQPTVDVKRLVADVNIDMPILTCDFGDVVAFGGDRSTLGSVVAAAARAEKLGVSPDPQPEEAVFTRSDHYPFVRQGVPSVFLKTGWTDTRGGMACKDAERTFRLTHYHEVSDQLDLPFDWAAAAKWTRLNIGIIRRIADATAAPRWYEGDYFGTAFAPTAPKAPKITAARR